MTFDQTVERLKERGIKEPVNYRSGRIRLEGANLKGANLTGAELWGAELSGVDLREAHLEEADLEEADLWGAGLDRAELSQANLSRANLEGANLERANLRNAELGGAYLTGANLRGADLRGADLRGVELTGAELEGVKNVEMSRDFAAEVLRRWAGDDVDRAQLAGLLIVWRHKCWNFWLQEFEHPLKKDAIEVLSADGAWGFREKLQEGGSRGTRSYLGKRLNTEVII